MNYNQLIELYKNAESADQTETRAVKKLLSPLPLQNAEDLESIIPSRFKYTGPGKWARIIKESQKD